MYELILIMCGVIQTSAINFSNFSDYCKLDCQTPDGNQKHTVCLRRSAKCGPGKRCNHYRLLSMTDDYRQVIVDKHNYLRHKLALGEETRGPQPAAANMNILNWSDELEFIAQCWANTCNRKFHDKCRRTEHLVVGQNVFEESLSRPISEHLKVVETAIQDWYDEVAKFNPASVQNFDGNPGVRNYATMMRAEIQYVGCGGALYIDGHWFTLFLVCNYGGPIAGDNLLGSKVYEIGKPCSKCPQYDCNKKYTGLCGTTYRVQTPRIDPSIALLFNRYSKSRYNSVPSTIQTYSLSNGVSDLTTVNNNRPRQKQHTLKIEVELPTHTFIRMILRNP